MGKSLIIVRFVCKKQQKENGPVLHTVYKTIINLYALPAQAQNV